MRIDVRRLFPLLVLPVVTGVAGAATLSDICTSASCTCAESQGQSVASPLLPRDQSPTRLARRGIPAPQGSSAQSCKASLTPHRVEYNLEIYLLNGRLTTVVTEVGAGFMASSVIEPVGMSKLVAHGAIQESSYFLTDEHGVRPEQYRSVDTLSREDQYVTFDFDWQDNVVEGTVNEEPVHYEIDGRVHDRVSIQYQLMLDLLNGGASDEYFMLDKDEIKLLEVENIGTRHVEVPYGEFEAIGIRHHKKDSSRVTTLWCVEELGYLPVIIEQHRDGKLRVRAELARYEELPAAPGQPAS